MRPSAREAPWHRSSVGLGRGIGAFLVLAVVAAGGSPLQAQANGDGQAQGNAAGDRAALVALYNATDGPNWVDNTNWLTDQPLSQWRGVITDGEGRVFGLLLYGNGLSGKLPVELGKLTRLTNLLLRDNDLSGPIPAELGNLTELLSLSLGGNGLSGSIPAELGNLTELLFLSLGGNGLSGSIPAELGNLTRLQRLDLRKNDLSGPIPAELGKLTRLSSLNLDGNRLSGAFPPELAALGRLEHLDLGQNARLAGTLPEALRDISALRRLDAEGTRLCAPGDAPFQEWLGTINFLGHNCRPYSGDSSLSVIDIAVFYTPAVARRYSNRPYGYQRFRAQIDLMFAGANQAFTDSGVYVELSLVGLEEVRYQERPDPVTVHRHFHGNYDGEMDEIHAERNSVGADIAVLVFESAEKYASAQVGSGFSTFSMQAMTPYSLAHEIGHNMGLLHDRHVSGRNWIYPYGHGYVNQRAFHESAEPRARWMTIMAYPNQCEEAGFECRPVMRFSNPDHEFRGDPLGAAGDNEDQRPADAVRALNEYRKTVANWRTRPEGLDPSAVTVTFDPPEITVAEGESATLRVRLSRSMGHPVTVSLSHGAGQFAGGSEGSDYSALPSSVTFESDQTEVPIEIQSIDDSLVEGAEGVVLEISESNLPWGLMIGSNPTATVSIQDNDLPQGPVVTTGPALVVEEGQTAVATLAATDTDTPATQLTWSIPAGSAGGTDGHLFALSAGGQLAFLAAKDYESPDDSDQDGTYEVTVQVTDGATPVTAAIQVRLANRNEAPTADAGADQSNVAEGASVTLAGSGTDPDADDVAGTLQFLWRQSDTGPHRVTLSNSNAASATFTAPSGLTADAVLRFALTVTDDGNLSGEDEVEVTVRRSDPPQVSISASSDQVAEGAPVAFEVTLDKAAPEALTVAVSVTENGSALSGTPPASLAFAKGATSATLSVPTAGDTVVESDSIVTATVTAGTGYTIGSTSSSAVTVKDDDAATFTVSAVPEAIAEGESATLTVAISNGVSFAEAQTISLAASGTASASDYTGVPPTLTLAAGVASVTATLAASADQEEEDAETVTVTASHGGSTIGSATVTINSISRDATLATLSLSGVDLGTFSGSVTSYQASVPNSVTSTTVTASATHAAATVTIEPGSQVTLAEGDSEITVTVTAEDGTTTGTYTTTVTREALPTATIAAGTTPITEGTAATYTVNLDTAAPEALTVAVSVTESSSALSGTPPASVAFAKGATSATLSVPTAGDTVVEPDSIVTATVTAGTGYTVGSTSSASVTVEDNDTATFTVSAIPGAIAEGESATLTVAVSNGVSFAEAQTISLAASGTASASDYTGLPPTLTLAAGASSVTATLAASADQDEEDAETVTVTASHGGSTIGSATVTINSVSDDATLAALSLSGIDIGTFSGSTTSYQASVANSVTATTVTATATHAAATVTIEPGSRVTLAEGANTITVTVTAEDGATTETYTITVRRAALPTATIAAGTTPVTEGAAATYTVTLDTAAPEALTVAVSVTESSSALSGTPPASVAFAKGATSATLSVPTAGDTVVESDSIVTATVTAGTGYTVGSTSSAAVTVEDNDTATFTVSAIPEAIAEGESATLTVAVSNGVSFAEAQTISLAASGTASASDYTGVPPTLTLAAGASSVTATLAASADQEEEDAETVTVTASHGGSAIGSATVTINSISRDATLATLSLSGVDIGTFSGSVTSYHASVPNSVTSTTVTATASHSGAIVSIDPGSEVALAEGANQIRVTVTAGDGTTRKNYTVTVTRAVLPVVSIAAVEGRARGPIGEVTASRTGPTAEPLDVQVRMTNTRTTETRTLTFRFLRGQSTMTRQVQASDNKLVEDDITVTWTLLEGEGYAVSGEHASASVVLEESDVPEFSVTVKPAEIAEGESATVTVATTNGVTFAEDQTISLATSGTASGSDYTGLPGTVTLYAYRTSTRPATLTAAVDQEEENAEIVTVTASHGGSTIGSATVTINSVSDDAMLAALSLSGIDIGTFSGATTSYQASVANSVTATTVTAAASHTGASVSIDPGSEVALAEGANRITITVTAESGARKTYTVTVTRAVLPVVSIAAVEGRERGPVGEVRASRTGPTAEPLDVQVHITNTSTPETVPMTFRFRPGQSSMTRRVGALDNKLVEDDITVTWTLLEGEGYAVSGEHASASVVLEESDVPEFSVTVQPAKIWEGESATVKVATTNGVTFAKDQTISLAASGTASASEYTGLPPTLTLPAGASSVTATLAASPDQEEEDAETVTVTASHEGSEIGSATVTIAASESPLPLTAEFAGMPATHDGETEFTFQLRFSEKINIRNEKLRDTAFEVTGGSVRGVRRVRNPPRHLNRRWRITVEPASDADVVLALPVTTDCKAKRAVCTPGGKGLSQRVTATVKGPSEVEAAGFPLAPENSRPSGIWSDGQTAWVADLDNARLYAYRRSDGEREPDRDIATEPAPMGLWSDGETLWVAGLGGGLRAHRLSDGTRQAWRDLALEANTVPAGVWSDGQTAWVADWLGDTVHAYRLSDGRRVADREIKLDGGNLLPVGLWSDGETLWVADWREWVYAYRLSDGGRDPARDVVAARADPDPTGLWSSGELLLATGWEDGQVRAYRLPTAESPAQGKDQSGGLPARAASIPPVADPALRAAIGAALGKAPGESVGGEELARLESLEARDAGIRDLAGLESATSLTVLDLGFNPLADLRPLAALPALEHLNLDGAIPDLQDLAALTGLKRLSLRHNGIRNLGILAGLTRLEELDAGDNLIEDLRPLSGLGQLEVLRADRNRIADLWPLASLARLEVLELGSNRIGDLQPLAGLAGLRKLRLAGNQFAELHPLSGLDGLTDLGLAGNAVEDLRALSDLGGLRRLDLRGNPVGDLRPLQALRSLAWVHVGGTRIEDLAPLNGVPSLTVAGRDDLRPPEAVGGGAENSNRD